MEYIFKDVHCRYMLTFQDDQKVDLIFYTLHAHCLSSALLHVIAYVLIIFDGQNYSWF